MTKTRIYMVAAMMLGVANVAIAASTRAEGTVPWGACFMDASRGGGGGNCACEMDTVDPDCAGDQYCLSQYPEYCIEE